MRLKSMAPNTRQREGTQAGTSSIGARSSTLVFYACAVVTCIFAALATTGNGLTWMRYIILFLSRTFKGESSIQSKLRRYGIPGSPATYPRAFKERSNYFPVPWNSSADSVPDTTAIILNWSRLENVILLAAVLCGESLSRIIAQVIIWNNNPRLNLTINEFHESKCAVDKLRIVNSPSNLYFRARYIACTESDSMYCFLQDDDYLVRPEIIRNMHEWLLQNPAVRSLHLMPAFEHLLSRSRTINAQDETITTTFAWLGYGTLMKRSVAGEFLSMLRSLNFTSEELGMADNYFTVLANEHKEDDLWFDHGIELGGGQAFTEGIEGHESNNRYMDRALEYLLSTRGGDNEKFRYSFVSKPRPIQTYLDVAPYRLSPGLIKSNIQLLPIDYVIPVDSSLSISKLSSGRLKGLGVDRSEWYIRNPLSNIVDGIPGTSFYSYDAAKQGDFIMIDLLHVLGASEGALYITLLIDESTERILQRCTFSTSVDGTAWRSNVFTLPCTDVWLTISAKNQVLLKECTITLDLSTTPTRQFRLQFSGDKDPTDESRWGIYEVWTGLRKS